MRHRPRALRLTGAALTVFALLLGLFLPQTPPAQAASAHDFTPGHIISDANFYDGNAMSSSQVQQFLNLRVPRCTVGDAGREAGSKWGNTKIAKDCLKDYRMNTTTIPSNPFCSMPYVGARNESAAKIIEKVGKACGISQKVLLVMLEKEQSLVSDSWPTERMIDVAMGYGCPDTGPGWSANCDPEYFGFQNQVYEAAWVYQYYKANPRRYRYKTDQWNSIQWHPNPGCGSSNVFIENDATAALYIYTPYRPNQAALNAGWGTGNNCSSYGNRNFFLLFSSWFGTPTADPITLAINAVYDQNPVGYGNRVGGIVSITENGGGFSQRFTNGIITYSAESKKAFGILKGSFLVRYEQLGGPSGEWGFIDGHRILNRHKNGGISLKFQHVTAIWASQLGVRHMPSSIALAWEDEGETTGVGYPTADPIMVSHASGYQQFENGTLMITSTSRAIASASQMQVWNDYGGLQGLGLLTNTPTTDTQKGTYFTSQKAMLFLLNDLDPIHISNGQFTTKFSQAGGPSGLWGWPTSDKVLINGGESIIYFENGLAHHSPARGITFMPMGGSSITIAPE